MFQLLGTFQPQECGLVGPDTAVKTTIIPPCQAQGVHRLAKAEFLPPSSLIGPILDQGNPIG
jgi:hypothetical protein